MTSKKRGRPSGVGHCAVSSPQLMRTPQFDYLSGSVVRCTVCRNQINANFRSKNLNAHPQLGVIMCKRCISFLASGNWTKDETGADEQCTWCGEGGGIFVCDRCQTRAFCKNCLRRHFGRKYVQSVGEQNWACLICDPSPLKPLQQAYEQILENLCEQQKKRRSKKSISDGTPQRSKNMMVNAETEEEPHKIESAAAATEEQKDENRSRKRKHATKKIAIKTLPFLLRRTLSWSKDFQDLIEQLQADLVATVDNTDADIDEKIDTAVRVTGGLREGIQCLKRFCNNMETSLECDQLCIRVGTFDDGKPMFGRVQREENAGEQEGTRSGAASADTVTRKRSPLLVVSNRKKRRVETETDSVFESATAEHGEARDTTVTPSGEKNDGAEMCHDPNEICHPSTSASEAGSSGLSKFCTVTASTSSDDCILPEPDISTAATRSSPESGNDAPNEIPRPITPSTEYPDGLTCIEIGSSEINSSAFSPTCCGGNTDLMKQHECNSSDSSVFVDAIGSPMKCFENTAEFGCNGEDNAEVITNADEQETQSCVKTTMVEQNVPDDNSAGQENEIHKPSARDEVMAALALDSSDSSISGSDEETAMDACEGNDEGEVENRNIEDAELSTSNDSTIEDTVRIGRNQDGTKHHQAVTNPIAKTSAANELETEECFNPVLEDELNKLKSGLSWKLSRQKVASGDEKPKSTSNKDIKEDAASSGLKDALRDESSDGGDEDCLNIENEEDADLLRPIENGGITQSASPSARVAVMAALAAMSSSSDCSDDDEIGSNETPRKPRRVEARPPCLNVSDHSVVELSSDTDDDNDNGTTSPKSKDQIRRERLLRRKLCDVRLNSGDERHTSNEKKKRTRKKRAVRVLSSSDGDHRDSASDCYFERDGADDESGDSSSSESDRVTRKVSKVAMKTKDEPLSQNSSSSSPMKGSHRRNIRPLMEGSQSTLEAQAAERDRRNRIAQMEANASTSTTGAGDGPAPAPVPSLLLDKDAEPLIEVDPSLVQHLKPHQIEGVKFLYRTTIESVKQKENPPGGCILAHCMGLGKTLQGSLEPTLLEKAWISQSNDQAVISYLHTVLTHPAVSLRTALVLAPLNVVLNWKSEFVKWLPDCQPLEVRELSSVPTMNGRLAVIEDWHRNGGVLILGYTLFKSLADGKSAKTESVRARLAACLLEPGPDIIVCDEGHVLKNEKTNLNICVNRVRTKRRICLTGTPLQNNLSEYHCMVQFVKPNLLGTINEFKNQFENPIKNGQCVDSTRYDVRIMKNRAHVLHSILEGCVHRMDYSVLTPVLPPRHEFVLMVRLSEKQMLLYEAYLSNVVGCLDITSLRFRNRLFTDFHALQRVCAHPLALSLHLQESEQQDLTESEATNIEDAIASGDDEQCGKQTGGTSNTDGPSCSGHVHANAKTTPTEVTSPSDDARWWRGVITDEECFRFDLSGKILLLMDLLWRCEQEGDKVLVFSQSLITLDVIENFLSLYPKYIETYHAKTDEDKAHVNWRNGASYRWKAGYDYLRVDGKTNAQTRKRYMKMFNDEKRPRCRLFLIATRAGGIGTDLIGANRVVIFDVSWNPSNDTQAIFRAYRYGQKKPVFIYRFVAQGTMEEVIYNRQVTKQSLALRVVDEKQIERHFNFSDLADLYKSILREAVQKEKAPMPAVPKDHILGDLLLDQKPWLLTYYEHDSLLQNVDEENLTVEEKDMAWNEYKAEREGRRAILDVPPLASVILAVPDIHRYIEYGNELIKRCGENASMEKICESWIAADPAYLTDPTCLFNEVRTLVENLECAMRENKEAEKERAISQQQEPTAIVLPPSQQPLAGYPMAGHNSGVQFVMNKDLMNSPQQFPRYRPPAYIQMEAPMQTQAAQQQQCDPAFLSEQSRLFNKVRALADDLVRDTRKNKEAEKGRAISQQQEATPKDCNHVRPGTSNLTNSPQQFPPYRPPGYIRMEAPMEKQAAQQQQCVNFGPPLPK